jgi:hypothetical protein
MTYRVDLFSVLRVYHITQDKALVCKVQVSDKTVSGVFIDGELPAELERAIRKWAVGNKFACPKKMELLGPINFGRDWTPSQR